MGVVQRQTLKGTFYSYLGVFIGFLTINILQPHALSKEQIGLLGILLPFSQMFAQFSILGFNGTGRYFPYFRNKETNNNGYLALATITAFVGFFIFCILLFIFKNEIISNSSDKNGLFNTYFWYLIPLTFFTLFFNVFDLYARMLYNTATGRILVEFVKRLFILFAVLLIFINVVSFETFMIIWLVANILPTFFMIKRLIKDKVFALRLELAFMDKDLKKKMLNICFFAILTGYSPLIIENLDKYMVNAAFGLGATGIYTIAYAFGVIITLPARSLYNIAYIVVAEAWKENDLPAIKELYFKSALNQFLVASFIFLLIWCNIDNIFSLLPLGYENGKYVVFFIGLGYLIDSSTGINGVILSTSKHYKWDSLFNVCLIGVTLGCNFIFIPMYGITGAAIAACVTLAVFNSFRVIFIYRLFKIQPFQFKTIGIIITCIAVYSSSMLIPKLNYFIFDGVVRSVAISILFMSVAYYFNLSIDVNRVINQTIFKLFKK